MSDDVRRGFVDALIGDGRPLLSLSGVILILCGGFALFLSATGHFLPHDVQFLGMTADQLCALHGCRIVHFMFHDRVAFGGAIMAVGVLYLWLAEFPLKQGEAWAWWLFVLSGVTGFSSFLSYLGYGYLDSWHGVATLTLLPLYVLGLVRTRRLLVDPGSIRRLLRPSVPMSLGRFCLLATALGMILGGATILAVGMTSVFVPQDLGFMGLKIADLEKVNRRLVPLIAHDRAGFGGGIFTCGWLVLGCVWCGAPSRSLWQALAIAGGIGFGCALGIHFLIGYTDGLHLAPAGAGAGIFLLGLALTKRSMSSGSAG
ncbi:MAG: hypothetical protein HY293_06555 [Planctomycetes bacterium]|nr:hypothetical protein [Planctomycetota bacterium]